MSELALLKKVVDDLTFLKNRVIYIEDELKEISNDLHIVRPSYLKKLEKIKQGKFHHYDTFEEFEKAMNR